MASSPKKITIAAIGNIYVETNYIGLQTSGKDVLEIGKEYRARAYETRLGGSVANFAYQAKLLGADVGLIGKVGNDENGKKLLDLLKSAEIATDLITVSTDPHVQTSIDSGLVLSHSGQNIQIVSGNANQLLSKNDINSSNPFFSSVSALYLGGFLKQESLYKDYPELLKHFSKKRIPIFLDHGRIPVDMTEEKRTALLQSLPFITGYLPNEDEIMGISKMSSIPEAADWALEMGASMVIIKLGSKGCFIKTKKEEVTVPGKHVQVISTVGAGDAFNAGFITHYLQGNNLQSCGEFANTVAALKVSTNKNPVLKNVVESLH